MLHSVEEGFRCPKSSITAPPAKAVPVWPRWLRIAFAAAAVPAALSPWLPMTWDISPFDVLLAIPRMKGDVYQLLLLAIPFFLSLPLLAWKIRLAIRDTPRRWEHWTLCIAALTAGFALTAWVVSPLLLADHAFEDPAAAGIAITLTLWILLALDLRLLRRRRAPPQLATTTLLITAYAGNAIPCIVGFHRNGQIGWTMTIAACVLLTPELILSAFHRSGPRHARRFQRCQRHEPRASSSLATKGQTHS